MSVSSVHALLSPETVLNDTLKESDNGMNKFAVCVKINGKIMGI